MTLKVCKNCNKELDISLFYTTFSKRSNKYYTKTQCKKCFYILYQRPYNLKNNHKYAKTFYYKHKEERAAYMKKYRLKQKIKKLEQKEKELKELELKQGDIDEVNPNEEGICVKVN